MSAISRASPSASMVRLCWGSPSDVGQPIGQWTSGCEPEEFPIARNGEGQAAGGCAARWAIPVLLLGAALAGGAALAAEPPPLSSRAATVASFVPTGWLIEQRSDGDLNNDGYEDALLLLREDAGAGSRESLSPTRIAVVLLGAPGGFALSASNSKLI